jgi:hypothetical protein
VHGVAVRLPRTGRDAASKTAAMSHAAYHILVDRFPDGRCDADAHMSTLGLDPAAPADPFSPAGIGRAQAAEHTGMAPAPDYWYRLARHLSVRDGHDDDRDVRPAPPRFTGGAMSMAAGQEPGKTIGARVFDKARRYWQGKP